MRAAYIGGGPTNVPYVPSPTLSLPFSFVSLPIHLRPPPSTTPMSIRTVLDISVRSLTAILRFNDPAKKEEKKTSIKKIGRIFSFYFIFRARRGKRV